MTSIVSHEYTRRQIVAKLATTFVVLGASTAAMHLAALMPTDSRLPTSPLLPSHLRLDKQQTRYFRSWLQLIVRQQLNNTPTPRWQQRDCAGLVRFASAEALQVHDTRWLKANGYLGKKVPPELNLTAAQSQLRHAWYREDGTQGAFVSAMTLVQQNTQAVGRDMVHAEIADLLLFDQGQAQHLMIWMGQYVAYHTGTVTATDNGLRAYPLAQLMTWKDTRWQPHPSNPNFLGIFRLSFLSAS